MPKQKQRRRMAGKGGRTSWVTRMMALGLGVETSFRWWVPSYSSWVLPGPDSTGHQLRPVIGSNNPQLTACWRVLVLALLKVPSRFLMVFVRSCLTRMCPLKVLVLNLEPRCPVPVPNSGYLLWLTMQWATWLPFKTALQEATRDVFP